MVQAARQERIQFQMDFACQAEGGSRASRRKPNQRMTHAHDESLIGINTAVRRRMRLISLDAGHTHLRRCLVSSFSFLAALQSHTQHSLMQRPGFEPWHEDRTVTFLVAWQLPGTLLGASARFHFSYSIPHQRLSKAEVLWDKQLTAPSRSVVALRLPPAEEVPGKVIRDKETTRHATKRHNGLVKNFPAPILFRWEVTCQHAAGRTNVTNDEPTQACS